MTTLRLHALARIDPVTSIYSFESRFNFNIKRTYPSEPLVDLSNPFNPKELEESDQLLDVPEFLRNRNA